MKSPLHDQQQPSTPMGGNPMGGQQWGRPMMPGASPAAPGQMSGKFCLFMCHFCWGFFMFDLFAVLRFYFNFAPSTVTSEAGVPTSGQSAAPMPPGSTSQLQARLSQPPGSREQLRYLLQRGPTSSSSSSASDSISQTATTSTTVGVTTTGVWVPGDD